MFNIVVFKNNIKVYEEKCAKSIVGCKKIATSLLREPDMKVLITSAEGVPLFSRRSFSCPSGSWCIDWWVKYV